MDKSEYKKGIIYTLGCYLLWGNFPLYWYSLRMIGSMQLMSQRILWSVVFVILIVTVLKEWPSIIETLKRRKILLVLFITSQLLFFNWMTYLWAITNNRVVDASLGYFLMPILNIFLGCLIFKERLSHAQNLAVFIVMVGIVWLTVQSQTIPFIALILATTFAIYGLLKKMYPVKTLTSITFETFFMLPFATIYLFYEYSHDNLMFFSLPTYAIILLLLSGAATTIPLLFFAEGAKKIPLSLIGIIQFVSPSLQMINGLLFFGESLTLMRLMGFVIIWAALAIFIVSEYRKYKMQMHLLSLNNS